MEENKPTTRDQLKTYFETGKHPTQNQFSDLIDSLRHREDVLNKKEMLLFANCLASIDSAFIYYFANNVGNLEIQIVVASPDEEDQVITIKDSTKVGVVRQYLFGSAPYTIKIKNISEGNLGETEYYSFGYQLSESYYIRRLFGNNLHTLPDGFDFGKLKNTRLPIEISKMDNKARINIVNTSIKFLNKTEVPIQYKAYSQYWGNEERSEDTVTDHYDAWDFLYISYNADLQTSSQNIRCDLYDADTNTLVATGYLYAGQSQESWWGGQVEKVRNVRIECNYSVVENNNQAEKELQE
ncbi:hypothetical protein [Chryseobacterium sp. JV274]|uniref:hypothetical protein n=1 Tax=unclassified Chryseobacterium TaxID=2593645 RepID=UPI0015C2762B|nr:hypothetical protein [Chryseobacterium sp. JV274]CAD0219799.1 conserved protein of unknown function [Chryseobacterium sp. JV274]